nr:MAG TPA: hypothetical protein [Crassvirales sp.]
MCKPNKVALRKKRTKRKKLLFIINLYIPKRKKYIKKEKGLKSSVRYKLYTTLYH